MSVLNEPNENSLSASEQDDSIKPVDLYKSALDHARQLSTLRFAILTVFITSNAALFSAYYTTVSSTSSAMKYPSLPICVAGCWLAVVFLICEISLSFTMACQNNVAKKIIQNNPFNELLFKHRTRTALWSIRILIPSIYVGSEAYWIFILKGII